MFLLIAFIVSGDWKQLEYVLVFLAIIIIGWGELAFEKVQVAPKYVGLMVGTAGKLDKVLNMERWLGASGWVSSVKALKNQDANSDHLEPFDRRVT